MVLDEPRQTEVHKNRPGQLRFETTTLVDSFKNTVDVECVRPASCASMSSKCLRSIYLRTISAARTCICDLIDLDFGVC
jgi:hypothetical protein